VILLVLAAILPAVLGLALGALVPGMPAGVALGAGISLPLLGLGAVAAVLGLGSLSKPFARGFARALTGAGAGFALRIGGVLTAAMLLGHDGAARVALATMAGCLFLGTVIETGLLMRALQKAVSQSMPAAKPATESIHA
jgi:hypothetical protein